MSPEMQRMCIGVKSASGCVAAALIFSCFPLAEFQTAVFFFFFYYFHFLGGSQRDTRNTDWLHGSFANVHMHDPPQISKTLMDLFRRDSTRRAERKRQGGDVNSVGEEQEWINNDVIWSTDEEDMAVCLCASSQRQDTHWQRLSQYDTRQDDDEMGGKGHTSTVSLKQTSTEMLPPS